MEQRSKKCNFVHLVYRFVSVNWFARATTTKKLIGKLKLELSDSSLATLLASSIAQSTSTSYLNLILIEPQTD